MRMMFLRKSLSHVAHESWTADRAHSLPNKAQKRSIDPLHMQLDNKQKKHMTVIPVVADKGLLRMPPAW